MQKVYLYTLLASNFIYNLALKSYYKLAFMLLASLFMFVTGESLFAHNFLIASDKILQNIPIKDNPNKNNTYINDEEDERLYSSKFSLESTFYANYIDKNKNLSSKNYTAFYINNLSYELFSTRQNGDSISLNLDLTYNNDNKEFIDTFLINELSLESKTLRSNLILGHSYPEFSKFSLSQRVFGIKGSQNYDKTNLDIFSGYKIENKDDIKKPVQVNGLNIKYCLNSSLAAGIRIVSAFDTRNNSPNSNNSIKNLPSIKNTVYSIDFIIKNNPNYWVDAEFAQSESIFDRRYPSKEYTDTAYRFSGGITRENWKFESGINYGGTNFLTYFGEAPRDERRIYSKAFFELNKYFFTQLFAQTSRDNLSNYKKDTIVKNYAELLFNLRPSEYYRDLNFQFLYQPLQEYSDNSKNLKKYRDEIAIKSFHKAGEFSYNANYQFVINKDKIAKINDFDTNKWELKISWDYNLENNFYTFYSNEFNFYKTAKGKDKIAQFGIGAKSNIKHYLVITMDFIREINTLKDRSLNSNHDKLSLSLIRDYGKNNNLNLTLEGSENKFENKKNDYNEVTGKLSFSKLF